MASPAPLKSPALQPDDWILAAFARLSAEGIDAVRIEVLARELRVSKGSFYWHFQDREELIGKMLARWELEESNGSMLCRQQITAPRPGGPALSSDTPNPLAPGCFWEFTLGLVATLPSPRGSPHSNPVALDSSPKCLRR